jgi:hypothetical protein
MLPDLYYALKMWQTSSTAGKMFTTGCSSSVKKQAQTMNQPYQNLNGEMENVSSGDKANTAHQTQVTNNNKLS